MGESVITRANFKGSREIGTVSQRCCVPGNPRAPSSVGNQRGLSVTQIGWENPVKLHWKPSLRSVLFDLFFKLLFCFLFCFFFLSLPSIEAIFKLFTNSENIWDLYQIICFCSRSFFFFCLILWNPCFAFRPVLCDNVNNNEIIKKGLTYYLPMMGHTQR